MSNKKNKLKQTERAIAFAEMLEMNEESMGEMAAYHVTCEMMDVDPDEGYELLMLAGDSEEVENV